MKNYEKPVVMVNEGLAEGVYAASGCWSGRFDNQEQKYLNGFHVFQIYVEHEKLKHTTDYAQFKITFSGNILDNAYGDTCSIIETGSNYVVAQTNGPFNGYENGDNRTFKVYVSTGDQATTETLTVESVSLVHCQVTTNVQGEGGDGN